MKSKRIFKILYFFALFSLKTFSFASEEPPRVFFSDLTDGPNRGWEESLTKGAAVTIWGKNFAASRGTSYVTVGGIDLTSDSDYAEWGVTQNNARGMERITFWLRSTCFTGARSISVNINGRKSNEIPFYVRTLGSIFFVDHSNGNNANNGLYSEHRSGIDGPWKTLAYARQNMNSGDILYIRNATYTEADEYGILYVSPALSGMENAFTAFVGYPGEMPILDTRIAVHDAAIRNCYDCSHHFVFSKMKIFPFETALTISLADADSPRNGYIRVVGIEADGNNLQLPNASTWSGCIDFHDFNHGKVLGCKIHHWGRDKFDHATYLGNNVHGQNVTNFEFAWNEVCGLGDDVSGIYIHPQDTDAGNSYADEIDIHDNLCHDLEHAGILIYSRAREIRIYNNIIYNCGTQGARSAVQLTPDDFYITYLKFYNNTIHSDSQTALLELGYDGLNAELKNNIFYSLGGTTYVGINGDPIVDSAYDLYFGNGGAPTWATNSVALDPEFVNKNGHDYHLTSLSPAKDAGVSSVNAIVNVDYDGLLRPQDNGYDIGACEYSSGYVPSPEEYNDSQMPSSVVGGEGGGGGGCFIAAVVYNSPMAKEELLLCKFRDKYLMTSSLGREIVRLYYKKGPRAARYISKREWLKKALRVALKPVVLIAKLMVGS